MTSAATLLLTLTLAITGGGLPAPGSTTGVPVQRTAPAAAAATSDASTVEMSLSGVETSALDDLPAVPPVPAETLDEATTGDSRQEPRLQRLAPRAAPAPDGADATAPDVPADAPQPSAPVTATPGTASPGPAPGPTPSQVTPSPVPEPAPGDAAEPEDAEPEDTEPGDASADPEVPADVDVLTAPLDTAEFSVLGLSWDRTGPGPDETVVRFRTRVDGTWTPWEAVGVSDIAPDPDSPEAGDGRRAATDPVVAVGADGLQVWADSPAGDVTGLKAVLVDPGTLPSDTSPRIAPAAAARSGAPVVRTAALVTAAPPPPTIISRAEWGADESLASCEPDLSNEVVAAAVHHTASTTSYGAADVPAILRGFHAYHTRPEAAGGRGWCDIGYNFLVDQFGRVFEGRGGGTDVPVVGVHTGGFNSRTFGVAAIGTFTDVQPTPALTEGIARTIAWKFGLHRIFASQNVAMVSGGGASRYPAGTVVVFPTIFGHRDAAQTSCPGQRLYDQLGAIRARVTALADASTQATPFGSWDGTSNTSAGVTVTGWAIDPGTSAPVTVRVRVSGRETSAVADVDRPDVAAAYPTYGSRHGFRVTAPVPPGRHTVCVIVTNVGDGSDRVLGCRYVRRAANPPPVGQVDSVTLGVGTATVTGWARDPDTQDPIDVHVYVDTGGTPTRADLPRPDLARFFPSTRHGFQVTVRVPAGRHQLCVYPINVPVGDNPPLSCRTVDMPSAPPEGRLDSVSVSAGTGTATVRGWARDADADGPVDVHVYVGPGGTATRADRPRPDLARFFPTTAHGFETTVRVPAGRHTVCAYAIDVPPGDNRSLGCVSVSMPATPPVGQVDSVSVGADGRTVVSGWARDTDADGPIDVHVYVGAGGRATVADLPRPDLRRYFATTAHGFSTTVTVPPGTHQVCAYAINVPAGDNPSIGCRTVTR